MRGGLQLTSGGEAAAGFASAWRSNPPDQFQRTPALSSR